MENLKRKKKNELAYMNIFCALLVIFIHCASIGISELDKSSDLFRMFFVPWRLSSFVVPAFIFLSGVKMFLGGKDRKINYFKFYLGRVTRVILPYMLWVSVFYVYFVSRDYFDFSWNMLFSAWLKGDLVGHFYFVIIIVQFYLLMPLWRWALKHINPALGSIAALIISIVFGYNLVHILSVCFPEFTFKYEDVVFTKYLAYWVLGCYVGLNYEAFKAYVCRSKLFITLLFIISGFLDVTLAYVTYGQVALWMDNVHLMYCMSAVLFFFMLFSFISQYKTSMSRAAKIFDAQSYNIYLSHCLIILWLNDVLVSKYSISGVTDRFIIVAIATYAGTILFWYIYHAIKYGLIKLTVRKTETRR